MATKTYKKFADEEISKAKSKDILDVARQLGMTLKKTGQSYRGEWQGHDTFTFDPRKNRFNWRSRGFGGDTITLFAVLRLGATNEKEATDLFYESIKGLNAEEFGTFDVSKAPPVKPFSYYLRDRALSREAYHYLEEERGFSRETIVFFCSQGLLVESTWRTEKEDESYFYEPVLVFKNFDDKGEIIGATVQGIYSYPEIHTEHSSGHLKRIVPGSGSYSGLNLVIGQPQRVVVCEASMDLMAYYELHKESLENVRLIAPDGYKPLAYSRFIAEIMGYGHWEQSAKEAYLSRINKALSKPENSGLFNKKTGNLKTEAEILKSYGLEDSTLEAQQEFMARFKKETPLYGVLHGFHEHLIHFAYDNDEAGRLFVSQFREMYPKLAQFTQEDFPPLHGEQLKNDWNDELKHHKNEKHLESVLSSYKQEELSIPEDYFSSLSEPPQEFDISSSPVDFSNFEKEQGYEKGKKEVSSSKLSSHSEAKQLESKLSLSKSLNDKNEKALQDYLQEEFKLYMKPDIYKGYLNLASRFPHFSSENIRLLYAQNSDLTEVRDFNSWKNDYGFSITKGSKAFYMYAPTVSSVEDEKGKPLKDSTGQVKTKVGQKLIPVFDRSQTTAPVHQLRQDEKIYETHYAKIYDALVRLSGATIVFQDMPEGMVGRCDISSGTIFIQRQMPAEATLQIVIDKICEWQMSEKLYKDNPTLSSSEVVLAAQSMSYMLKQQLNMDTSRMNFDVLYRLEGQEQLLERFKTSLSVVQESTHVLHLAMIDAIHSEAAGIKTENSLEQLIAEARESQAKRIQAMQEGRGETPEATPQESQSVEDSKKVSTPTHRVG